MVKCSFILGFAAIAVASSFGRAATVGNSSALNDTSASAATDTANATVAVTLPSVPSNDTSASAATEAAVTDAGSNSTVSSSSASAAADVANTTTPATTTAATVKPTTTPTLKPAAVNATNTNSTEAPAPTAKAGPQPIAGQVTLVPGYSDCGGVGFNYTVYMPEDPVTSDLTRLTCEPGYRCQGVDGSDVFTCDVWPSREPVPFYGQCGGGNYDGQTFCAPGAVCKYISPSFSQCLPTY